MALISSVLGIRSQILILWMNEIAFFHSPAASAFDACITWSRVFSGGPVKICRSWYSSMRLYVLLMTRFLTSGDEPVCASSGISRSMLHVRYTHSRSSRLMCMWKGSCLCFSSRSCSGETCVCLCIITPCARNSFCRPLPHTSCRVFCASYTSPLRNAQRPTCTTVLLYRICVWMSKLGIVSWRCDMSAMSLAL
ncbi:hypothetical protein VUR80DRAFT_1877 [Thermomyces stellatus]